MNNNTEEEQLHLRNLKDAGCDEVTIQSGVTRRCNAGVNKFSISPEGKLYPCDSFLGIPACYLAIHLISRYRNFIMRLSKLTSLKSIVAERKAIF